MLFPASKNIMYGTSFMNRSFFLFAFITILFAGCTSTKTTENSQIAIVYTNDVHNPYGSGRIKILDK